MRKELAGNPYSSMALAKEAAEAVPIFEANNYGNDILWGCFLMSMRSVQRTDCNFIVDWTAMGKISIVGLALATSELATTDLPERSHQPGPDFIFPSFFQNIRLGRKVSFQDLTNTLGFQSFLHSNEAEDTVICHSCMKMLKEKKNKTSTKADPAFVSSA